MLESVEALRNATDRDMTTVDVEFVEALRNSMDKVNRKRYVGEGLFMVTRAGFRANSRSS
jgi:argininosuccinate lyase